MAREDEQRERDAALAAAMLDEAGSLVARAEETGVVLRLIGGVAVRWLLAPTPPRAAPPRDVDLVGLRRQTQAIVVFMSAAGFEENRVYRLNSGGRMMQFFRPCRHVTPEGPGHPDDRVDVYLDALRLEHSLPLHDRLGLCAPTVPASDVLLAKLMRTAPSLHDVDDALSLVRHLPVQAVDRVDAAATGRAGGRGGRQAAERPNVIDVRYIAACCARSWGLYHDVRRNIEVCRDAAGAAGTGGRNDVLDKLTVLECYLAAQPKSLAWRLRAPFGERLPWSDAVEERDGRHLSSREHIADSCDQRGSTRGAA